MALIYEPKGKAREYSPLALNVYTQGCEHRCAYCYCRNMTTWGDCGKPRDLAGLSVEAAGADKQILLSFMSDPYAPCERTHRQTRTALGILRAHGCSVAILTKGGTRALDDLAMFRDWPERRIKVGATLTFAQPSRAREWEPGAACPADRVEALRVLHDAGVQTWVSIEPVIEPDESLAIMWASLPYVDAFKVGKLNHTQTAIDWAAFGLAAVSMLRGAGKQFYVKDDLRKFLPAGYLTAAESTADSLNLPERKGLMLL